MVVAMAREEERFVFIFTPGNASQVLQKISQAAGNKELNFTWFDAAIMSHQVRRML